ncbi:hypothetical protein QTQ03_02035 [Micromonospora sp. WMMA1363]|uniref:hypothetical protein n=1 Tax=Micromonospora sp. WMMA1363 TaxID=3053985 RepID=UPI00259C9F32|nr:hypothetical protein [Micromonospora sp. WMMA1363]MDM4718429.1 hypothetical protein [Micromonospora sp. WMMA1363]
MFTALWIGWLAAFAIVEGIALFNKQPDDTLSEHVWKWFAVGSSQPTGWTRLRRFALLAFMAWLTLHFLTGGIF